MGCWSEDTVHAVIGSTKVIRILRKSGGKVFSVHLRGKVTRKKEVLTMAMGVPDASFISDKAGSIAEEVIDDDKVDLWVG